MLKKMEDKQNTPSVIARLMGLDELPPQQPLHRQLRVLSEDYLQKTASIGLLEKSSIHMRRISRKTAEKQHGVKHDSDSEIPNTEKRSPKLSRDVRPNQGTEKAQFIFAREKNAYPGKHHSIDKKLYHAEELNNVYEDRRVTRGNSLRYFSQSNLSTRQLHDSKALQLHLRSGHLAEPTSTSKQCKKSGKMFTEMNSLRSIQKIENNCGESDMDYLNKLSETHSKLKDKAGKFSTRIVVLQPNSRKTHNSVHKVTQDGNTTNDMEPLRNSCTDPWKVEKKAAIGEMKSIVSRHRGTSGSRITVKDSVVSAPEALMTSSEGSFPWENGERISNLFPSRSFFATEAKKQIFERWKTTKSFEEAEVSGRRCTLGQMFAMQDGEAKPKSPCFKLEKNCFDSSYCPQKGNPEFGSSLVISSKVGSTNEYIQNLPRPKFWKNASIAIGGPNFKTRNEASQIGYHSGQKEAVTDKIHKLNSENFHRKDSIESRDSRVIFEKQHHFGGADSEGSHNLELSSSNILSSVSDDTLSTRVNQGVQDDLEEDMHKEADSHKSSDVWENLVQQKSPCPCASPGEELNSKCDAKDSDLVISLREVNQPSPDSVLEPLFKEENLGGSEFFESPVSDLSGLAMKLHLLNPESEETNSEGSGMAVSSDEDTEKGSVDLSQDNKKMWGMIRPEESRDFSYIVDVLDEANLCGTNLDIWDDTESPLSPSIFEALEKKYGKQTSWVKSERRLLFDFVNSGLREILDSCMNFCMATKPLRRKLSSTLRMDDIEEELWMLLSQEKEVSKDLAEKALGREMKWMELGDDINIICSEIVEYTFDELATELFSSECL